MTKTLDPNIIKKVQVRFDEKNEKLKESLLNNSNFVVLDIKLKDNFNKLFFWKSQRTIGVTKQKKLNLEGNTSIFSLSEKFNAQLFLEKNNTADNLINLHNIKKKDQHLLKKLTVLKNSISPNLLSTFSFISNNVSLNHALLNNRLQIQSNFKHVHFVETGASFKNLDFKISFKASKIKVYSKFLNILNATNFSTQENNNSLLYQEQNKVFSRYISFGLEFKIN